MPKVDRYHRGLVPVEWRGEHLAPRFLGACL